MLTKLIEQTLGEKNKNLALAVGGMAALLTGQKLAAISMFGTGLAGLEKAWREAHPDFHGSLEERWNESVKFYEQTHSEPTNRTLHVIGIPMIVGGAVGLLLWSPFRPLWFIAAGSFTAGWVLNFIGHGLYEKKKPAFADDPLAFLAGPAWDFTQMLAKRKGKAREPSAPVVAFHADAAIN